MFVGGIPYDRHKTKENNPFLIPVNFDPPYCLNRELI